MADSTSGSFFTQEGTAPTTETGNGSFMGEIGAADVLVTNFQAVLTEAQTVAASASASAATVSSTIGQANAAQSAAQASQTAAAASAAAAAASEAAAAASATTAATAAVASVWTTGDVKVTLKVSPDTGWVMFDDGTIGNAGSGASNRANADTQNLYDLLWTSVSDSYCPVVGGRGSSAAADFAALKPITLPRVLGRALAISGTGSGLTGHVLASYLGEEAHTLTSAELATHNHLISDPGHTHTVTDSGHVHSITDPSHNHSHSDPGHNHSHSDPGHNHGVGDPGHAHAVADPGHAHGVADPGHAHTLDYNTWGNYFDGLPDKFQQDPGGTPIGTANKGGPAMGTFAAGTGIGIYGAFTGIGIYAAGTGIFLGAAATGVTNVATTTGITNVATTTGITIQNHATGITNNTNTTGITTQNNTGGGGAHNNLQPTTYFNIMVKL